MRKRTKTAILGFISGIEVAIGLLLIIYSLKVGVTTTTPYLIGGILMLGAALWGLYLAES